MSALLIFLFSQAMAVVDLKTGNFSDSWVDGQAGQDFRAFQIRRVYNSKSTWDGVFGLGWCGSIELKLKIEGKKLSVTSCDNRNMEFISGKSGFTNSKFGTITKSGSEFKWEAGDGFVYKFNATGDFEALKAADAVIIFSRGSSGLVEKIMNQTTGENLSLVYGADRRHVEKIIGGKVPIEYEYQNALLKKVRNGWGNSYTYNYDDNNNLNQISYPDKTSDEIEYEKAFGKVISFKPRTGCAQKISYEKLNNSHTAKVTRDCQGRVSEEKVFFAGITTKMDGYFEERDQNGAVTFLQDKNSVNFAALDSLFKYDRGAMQTLFYGKDARKPSAVTLASGATEQTYAYTYNSAGALVRVSGNKFAANLSWDKLNRLIVAKFIKSNELRINYWGGSNKIASIAVKGFPPVKIKYHADGNVMKLETTANKKVQARIWDLHDKLLQALNPIRTEL